MTDKQIVRVRCILCGKVRVPHTANVPICHTCRVEVYDTDPGEENEPRWDAVNRCYLVE